MKSGAATDPPATRGWGSVAGRLVAALVPGILVLWGLSYLEARRLGEETRARAEAFAAAAAGRRAASSFAGAASRRPEEIASKARSLEHPPTPSVRAVAPFSSGGSSGPVDAALPVAGLLSAPRAGGMAAMEILLAADGSEIGRASEKASLVATVLTGADRRALERIAGASGEPRSLSLSSGSYLVVARRVRGPGWLWARLLPESALRVAAAEEATAVAGPAAEGFLRLLALQLAGVAALGLALVGLVGRFLSPLRTAADYAGALAGGTEVAPPDGGERPDEVGRVVRALGDLGRRIHRRTRLTEGGHELARATSLMTRPEETLDFLSGSIASLVGARRVSFLLFDPSDRSLVPARLGTMTEPPGAEGLRIGWDDHSLAMLSFRSGETFVSGDVQYDTKASTDLASAAGAHVNVVFTPLRTEVGALGVLVVADKPGGFDADDRAAIEAWADTASLLLRNARLYEELQKSAERLQRVIRGREHFLQDVNHELRTPLTAIVGWAEVLSEDRPDEATAATAVEQIRRSAEHLVTLVSDLLDLARLEEGASRVDRKETDVALLVRSVLDALAVLADARGIALEVDLPPEGAAVVSLDPGRTRQVLWNLVHNALKFTPPGGRIAVSARVEEGAALLRVADDGPGISARDLPFIFERWRQSDAGRATPHRGSGVGLSLARGFVEAHGGTISVDSVPGRGAAFLVRIPPPAEPPEPGRRG